MIIRRLATIAALTGSLATTSAEQEVFTQASNDTLLWNPRPNLYFGLRPRIPKSLSLGLLWGRTDNFDQIQQNVRYTCEQHEGMAGYGWETYDPRKGGLQTIHDQGNNVDIETSFAKLEGGAWAARIKGTPLNDEPVRTSVWLTLGIEGVGVLEVDKIDEGEDLGYAGDVSFSGSLPQLGDFSIKLPESTDNVHPIHKHAAFALKPLDHTLVHSLDVPEEALWQSKPLVFSSIKTTFDAYLEEYGQEHMPPPYQVWTIQNRPGAGNVHLVEKVFEGPFAFDVIYTPKHEKAPSTGDLDKQFRDLRTNFDSTYNSILKPLAPYTGADYVEFSKGLFSNLVGGIGYFHGDQVIDRSYSIDYEENEEGFWEAAQEARAQNLQKLEGPYELFTSIPSRPFFPRGFLWDEGFHLLPILDWDMEVTMQIVSSWFNTMDSDGWIAREQILGTEARSKVPQEFQTQYPHYANPPTLYMVIEALLDKITGKTDTAKTTGNSFATASTFKSWLQQLYPALQLNFQWYRNTQIGDIKSYDRKAFSSKEAYRWRGRTPRHILTSGLDDYPRAQPPHPGELHVDLLSWMGMAARAMHRIALYLEETYDAEKYAKVEESIKRNVDDLHWDAAAKTYCDASVDDYEESMHVCHKGYISIFPFMTGLLDPSHPHLGDVLDLIGDENELWSKHGIRSLSKSDALYGTDENYWRSPVWMNMNYLIIKNLYDTASRKGPQQQKATKLYSQLRSNLVNTVYKSWKETGFAWEQYNPETGAGQRTQHFTGWTSLIVKILAMPDKPEQIRDEL